MSERITITAGDGTRAVIATHGAEPVSWHMGGTEYLWSGDPAHWDRHAPWLFPVVGASANGAVTVGGRAYPMAQHGFARDLPFTVTERTDDTVTLRLEEDNATLPHYPFPFRLDITARVGPGILDFEIWIENTGPTPLPYALGFHPAFPWPFAGGERSADGGYRVDFQNPERPLVPEVGEGGLLLRTERAIPLEGATLPLDPALFTEALVLRDAASEWMRFTAPDGSAIRLEVSDFPHLAVWTKPTAPFLSLECWTGHADWAGYAGELARRDSQRLLAPKGRARHGVTLSHEAPVSREAATA